MALLERESILAELREIATSASAGRGSVVFLSGEAGAGKTSVIRAFACDSGAPVKMLIGSCDPMPTPGQLWPLNELAINASSNLRELVANGASREQLFRGTLAELDAGAGATIMVIEDLHWADEATLDLIRFVGRRIATTHGVLIATYRADDLAKLQRVRLLLGDLATEAATRRISLPLLSREAVRQMSTEHEQDADAIYDRTGGNPFFVTELLSAPDGVPGSISDAVAARLAGVSPSSRELIELAAILGQIFDLPSLAAVAGHRVEEDLQEAIDRGVLQIEGKRFAFRHALLRDAILHQISPMRRSMLAERVLDALAAEGVSCEPARLAHYAEQAGRDQDTYRYSMVAGDEASSLRSYREAAAQYMRAIRYSNALPLPDRSNLLRKLAEVTFFCGSGETDINILHDLVRTARELNDPVNLAENLAWLGWMLADEGESEQAAAAGQEALEIALAQGDDSLTARMLYTRAQFAMSDGFADQAISLAERALERLSGIDDELTALRIRHIMGTALLPTDEARAFELIRSVAAEAQLHRYDSDRAHAVSDLGFQFAITYRLEDAERHIAELIELSSEYELDCWKRYGDVCMAFARFAQGRWSEAASQVELAVRVRTGCFQNQVYAYLILSRLRARRGDPEVDAAIAASECRAEHAASPLLHSLLAIAKSEGALLAGNRAAALAIAQENLPYAVENNLHWQASELAQLIVSSGGKPDAPFVPIGPFVHELAGDWQSAYRCWQELGAPYEAARAQSLATSEEPLRAALATFERLGAQPMAATVTRKMRELGIKSIPIGPRQSTRSNAFGLTARETDVLKEMEAGWTNAEIAHHLFLSPKTVEHHVSSILSKLGARSRREAVRIAQGSDPDPDKGIPAIIAAPIHASSRRS